MDDSEADLGVQTQMATYTVLPGSSEPLVFPFLCEYKTPSVFDKEPLETAMHEHRFNETVIYALDNTAFDMLSDLMIKVTLPDISSYNARWANTTGHTLVEYACVVHNDLELARYTGESLNILFQLDTNAGHYRARCEMVNHKATSTALDGRKQVLYIEIPFFKSNEDKQMFPALLCNRNELSIRVKYRPISECIFVSPTTNMVVDLTVIHTGSILVNLNATRHPVVEAANSLRLRSTVQFDAYHLTQEERYLFIHRTGDMLFKRFQYRTHLIRQGTTKITLPMDFKGSVSELIVGLRSVSNLKSNDRLKYLKLDTIALMIRSMHTEKSPAHKYLASGVHKCIPSTYIYTIPFCLSATHTQPSGHVYFQGIRGRNSITIEVDKLSTDAWFTICANTYTRFVFRDGTFQVEDVE
jgi:hypothetical protein